MDDIQHEDGITQALSAIHAGGHRLVIMARQRVARALDHLDAGTFDDAVEELNMAAGYLGSLANAKRYIGIADGSRMTPAAELKVGDHLTDVGEVTHVEVTTCAVKNCRRHVEIKVGEHELKFYGDTEVYVVAE